MRIGLLAPILLLALVILFSGCPVTPSNPFCGDSVCELGEKNTCARDCGSPPKPGPTPGPNLQPNPNPGPGPNPNPKCTDECKTATTQCSGEGYKACGNFDADSCTEWSAAQKCEAGKTCIDGECKPRPRCGNNRCEAAENISCPSDCGISPQFCGVCKAIDSSGACSAIDTKKDFVPSARAGAESKQATVGRLLANKSFYAFSDLEGDSSSNAQSIYFPKEQADEKMFSQLRSIDGSFNPIGIKGRATQSSEADFKGYIVELEGKPLLELRPEAIARGATRPLGTAMFTDAVDTETKLIRDEDEIAKKIDAIFGKTPDRRKSYKGSAVKDRFYKAFYGLAITNAAGSELAQIKNIPGVRGVYPDYKVEASLAQTKELIGVKAARDAVDGKGGKLTGKGIKVAVIDTGVDYKHPDLGGCLGKGCKVYGGYDFVNKDSDPLDDDGHGTHVAGIIAGTGKKSDGKYEGIAPEAEILAVKVLDAQGGGSTSDIINGMEYALDPNDDSSFEDRVDVVNLSLGGGGSESHPLSKTADTLAEHGIVVVAAAGNSGPGNFRIGTPAAAGKIITVASATHKEGSEESDGPGKIAFYSSRGPTPKQNLKPDIVAPGGDVCRKCTERYKDGVVSTKISGLIIGNVVDDYYTKVSGTSMAAPHIAGVAALLLQKNHSLSPDDVKRIMKNSAVDTGADVLSQGAGLVNVALALENKISFPEQVELGKKNGMSLAFLVKNNSPQKVRLSFSSERAKCLDEDKEKDVTINLDINPAQVEIQGGGSEKVTVSSPDTLKPCEYFGGVRISDGKTTRFLPVKASNALPVSVEFYSEEATDMDFFGEESGLVAFYLFKHNGKYYQFIDRGESVLSNGRAEASLTTNYSGELLGVAISQLRKKNGEQYVAFLMKKIGIGEGLDNRIVLNVKDSDVEPLAATVKDSRGQNTHAYYASLSFSGFGSKSYETGLMTIFEGADNFRKFYVSKLGDHLEAAVLMKSTANRGYEKKGDCLKPYNITNCIIFDSDEIYLSSWKFYADDKKPELQKIDYKGVKKRFANPTLAKTPAKPQNRESVRGWDTSLMYQLADFGPSGGISVSVDVNPKIEKTIFYTPEKDSDYLEYAYAWAISDPEKDESYDTHTKDVRGKELKTSSYLFAPFIAQVEKVRVQNWVDPNYGNEVVQVRLLDSSGNRVYNYRPPWVQSCCFSKATIGSGSEGLYCAGDALLVEPFSEGKVNVDYSTYPSMIPHYAGMKGWFDPSKLTQGTDFMLFKDLHATREGSDIIFNITPNQFNKSTAIKHKTAGEWSEQSAFSGNEPIEYRVKNGCNLKTSLSISMQAEMYSLESKSEDFTADCTGLIRET